MKKWLIPVAAVVAVLAAGVASVVLLGKSAVNKQAQTHEAYIQTMENIRETTLTITENGNIVGSYSLEQLGVLDDTVDAAMTLFDQYDRMDPYRFSETSIIEKLKWRFKQHAAEETVPVQAQNLELTKVTKALDKVSRHAPQDARVVFEDGAFRVIEEDNGNQLDMQAVQQALTQAVAELQIGAQAPAEKVVELAEQDCYAKPAVTVENGNFDFRKELDQRLETMDITVDFHGEKQKLTADELRDIVTVEEDGALQIQTEILTRLVDRWHEQHRDDGVPYQFKAQIGGVKPMDFLLVDYEINKQAMTQLLEQTLSTLEPAEIEAQWYCWRKGEAFAIEGEYVEIDIPNQKMTYVKDGEVLVSTDIVTGATWGYPTPPGYYKVENKDTDCWLQGEDYNVHVDYWIGFIGFDIGIHDADWRTKFGGTNYVRNGSHGCVNTPKEATAVIFENIEVGVPVLVYGK